MLRRVGKTPPLSNAGRVVGSGGYGPPVAAAPGVGPGGDGGGAMRRRHGGGGGYDPVEGTASSHLTSSFKIYHFCLPA